MCLYILMIVSHNGLIQSRHYEQYLVSLCPTVHLIWERKGPPSSKTIEVPTAHDVEKVKRREYRGMVSSILTAISTTILKSHNSGSPPPIQNLWFVFNMAVFMNQYFTDCDQDARVVPVYWKNDGHSHMLKALRVEMQCGDVRKYHEKTSRQKCSRELQARKKLALRCMPEEVVNHSSSLPKG